MAGRDRLRHGVESHADPVTLARGECLGSVVACAVGEVEQAIADAGGPAVGRDVGEPDGDHRDRLVDRELEVHHRGAEDLHPLGEDVAVEGQGAAVLFALVVGEVGWCVVGAPLPGELAHRQWGLHGQDLLPVGAVRWPRRAGSGGDQGDGWPPGRAGRASSALRPSDPADPRRPSRAGRSPASRCAASVRP